MTNPAPAIDIDALTGRKLDAAMAEHVMGWELMLPIPERDDGCSDIYYRESDVSIVALEDMPPFSFDANRAREVEAEIERWGLSRRYVWSLVCIVEGVDFDYSLCCDIATEDVFKLIAATPEQRCRAALRAVMDG